MTCHICGYGVDEYPFDCECGCRAFNWSWRIVIACVLWRGGSRLADAAQYCYESAMRYAAKDRRKR